MELIMKNCTNKEKDTRNYEPRKMCTVKCFVLLFHIVVRIVGTATPARLALTNLTAANFVPANFAVTNVFHRFVVSCHSDSSSLELDVVFARLLYKVQHMFVGKRIENHLAVPARFYKVERLEEAQVVGNRGQVRFQNVR